MEIELKFQMAVSEVPAMVQLLKNKDARLSSMCAHYYDSEAHDLFKAGIAARLRKEGRVWVQTLKVGNLSGALARQEHSVPLKIKGVSAPTLDIERHRHADGWSELLRVMQAGHQPILRHTFSTDVKRMTAQSRTRYGKVEYALDRGEITASLIQSGGAPKTVTLTQPVCELEIELVSGSPRAIVEAAIVLLKRHAVWLDIRSKSVRGDALSQGLQRVQARKASVITFTPDISQAALTRMVISECILHVLFNVSQIASAEGHEPEHIHQLRIGLRRLRTALRLFGRDDQAELQAWGQRSQALAVAVGHTRDRDMIAATFLPALQLPDAPLMELIEVQNFQSPAEIIRDKDIQAWLLDMVAWQLCAAPSTDDASCAVILPIINKWHARCVKGAMQFDTFSIEQRHRLRKQMKRLRYGLEFVEPLCKPTKFRAHAKVMSKAQEALGGYNDLHTALVYFRSIVSQKPEAWFAVGWLSGQIAESEYRCTKVLKKYAQFALPF